MNYAECIKMNYMSTRKETFYNLQLYIKGSWDVYASFNQYVKVEHLENDSLREKERLTIEFTLLNILQKILTD